MLQTRTGHYLLLSLFILILLAIFLFRFEWGNREHMLTFAMLDVGQGDALFIESPAGTQVLVDGGPSNEIMSELSKVMPPYDKSIDAIIITNPDADHIAGFLKILDTYEVDHVFESGTYNDSSVYNNLEEKIYEKKIPNTLARQGMRLDLGGGAVLDFLFPDRDVSLEDTNEGSIVAKLTYGNTSIMLMGDAIATTEREVLKDFDTSMLKSNILKVGHHGSRTSSSPEFVQAVSPRHALISSGADNKYGHPHRETLDTLTKIGAQILRTDQMGTIIIKSNGAQETFLYK